MAKIFQVLETQYNSNSVPNGRYVAYRSNQVLSVVDKTGYVGRYSVLTINKLDGSSPDRVEAASAASSVMVAINAANTSDIHEIAVTVIPTTGSNFTKNISVDYIHRVQVDPLNAARSWMQVEDQLGQEMAQYHITSTVAAIVTAANS